MAWRLFGGRREIMQKDAQQTDGGSVNLWPEIGPETSLAQTGQCREREGAPVVALRRIALVALGVGLLMFSVDAAMDVEEAYATVCAMRSCPSIGTDIYMLKLCAVTTAIAVPAALAWAIDKRRDHG